MSRQELKRESVNLTALEFSFINQLQKAHPERKINFTVQEYVNAVADKALIDAVIKNLLCNACKFASKKERAKIECGKFWNDKKKRVFL